MARPMDEGVFGMVLYTQNTAVKYSKDDFVFRQRCNRALIREATALKTLNHPNIVSATKITLSPIGERPAQKSTLFANSPALDTSKRMLVIEMPKGTVVDVRQRPASDAEVADFFGQIGAGLRRYY